MTSNQVNNGLQKALMTLGWGFVWGMEKEKLTDKTSRQQTGRQLVRTYENMIQVFV